MHAKPLQRIVRGAWCTPILLSVFIGACGGSGQGLDTNGRPLSEQSKTNTGTNQPSNTSGENVFSSIQRDVLDVSCATSGCHSGTSAPLGLNLDAGKAYANLVSQSSIQVSGLLLVEPSNPDASYLVAKLEGTQDGGLQMPLGKPAINAQALAQIRQWILDGALESDDEPVVSVDPVDVPIPTIEPVLPTLDDIQSKIFDPLCISCHAGTTPSANLNLELGESYLQLVERPSTIDVQAKPLVSIDNPENSFLVDKLRGRSLGSFGDANYRGSRMPVVGGYLSESQLQAVEQWISAGATEMSSQ